MAAYDGAVVTDSLDATMHDHVEDRDLVSVVKALVVQVNKLTAEAEARWTS